MALGNPTYEPTYLVHQMGGVMNGAWSTIMQATIDFADQRSNVHLTGPTTPYGFSTDRVHPPGQSQVLMGEWDFHAYKRVRAGLPICLRAQDFERTGAVISVPHTSMNGSVEIDTTSNPNMTDASGFDSSGSLCVYGVEVLIDGTAVPISSVTSSGLTTTITLATDPGATTTEFVRFGLMENSSATAAVPDLVSRNNIKSDWAGIPSIYVTDFVHEAWQLNEELEEASP